MLICITVLWYSIKSEVRKMSVGNKIKSAMLVKNVSRQELAQYFNLTEKAITAKFYRDSFSAEDLIKIADCLGYTLDFTSVDNKITFTLDDIPNSGEQHLLSKI
jgi:transcriptional regulator with XRE-family HTH domain